MVARLMLQIRTLGGMSIHGAGRAPAGAATQPRRLAVLAYVARAGDRGVTREKLLALLWPDADEDAGRRALSQSLYALRRDLSADELFLGVQDLRLNPEVATCDVLEFETAVAERNLEHAASLYVGPFLDGFRLPGAAEFDRWADTERRALQQRHLDMLERLARRLADRGDPAGAAAWWRRIADLDPLNARVAIELMRALVAAGDPGGALNHARIYEALLAQELDVEPDHQVIELAKRIRAETNAAAAKRAEPPGANGAAAGKPAEPPRPIADDRIATTAGPNVDAVERPAAVVADATPTVVRPAEDRASPTADSPLERPIAAAPQAVADAPPAVPVASVHVSRRSRPLTALAVLAAVTTLAAAAWWIGVGRETTAITPVLAVGRITDYRTSDGREAEAVSDMLATNLARVPGLQVLSNARLYEVLAQSKDTQSRGALAAAAQQAGATQLLEGGLHALADGRLRLDLRRVDLTSGAVRTAHQLEGSDVYALVSEATTDLSRSLDRPVGRLDPADVSTRSLVAYRFYEEGLRHNSRGDYHSAERLFDAAIREDSAFAMAAFYLMLARGTLGVSQPPDTWSRVLALAARAPERERLLIRGTWALTYGHPELQAIADTLAARYPAEVDGPFLQGYARLYNLDFIGGIAYMKRVFAMDSLGLGGESARCRACDAVEQLIYAYESLDSLPTAERIARDYVRRQPKSARAWVVLAGVLVPLARHEEAIDAHRKATSINSVNMYDRIYAGIVRLRGGDFEETDRIARSVMRSGSTVDAAEARWLLLISLRYQSRWREALTTIREATAALSDAERTGGAAHTAKALEATVLLESGRAREAATVFDSLIRNPYPGLSSGQLAARFYTYHYTLLANALATAGDTARLAVAADSAAAWSGRSNSPRDSRLREHSRGLLLAARGDTAGAIAAFQRAIISPTTGFIQTNRALGTLFLNTRRPTDAVRVLGAALRSPTLESGSLYVTWTELHELIARAYDDLRMADSAATHYRHVVRALERSDAEAKPRYEAASRRLAALGAKR